MGGPTPRPFTDRFWKKVAICQHGAFCPFCCWEWKAGKSAIGYGWFGVQEQGKWRSSLAHTVAWVLVNERPIPHGLQINHHCDNPSCCSIWHIYAGTQTQNMMDASRRHRVAVGEARSHLRAHEVLLMAPLYRQGYTLRDLAQKFHTGQPTVYKILNGQSWKHLPAALSSEERRPLLLAHYSKMSRTRPRTILTEDNVREIRRLIQQRVKRTVLAQQFGVHVSTIKGIAHRRIWKNVLDL